MSAPQQKLKILALHGHAMSGELLKAKIGAIRQDTKKVADWFFPDAPISIPSADAFIQKDAQKTETAEGESNQEKKKEQSPVTSAAPGEEEASTQQQQQQQQQIFSWYDFSKVSHALSQGLDLHKPCSIAEVKEPLYTGMGEAMQYLGNYAEEHGPFDIIFSFSQGTILAALIVCQMNYQRRLDSLGKSAVTGAPEEVQTLASRLPQVPSLLSQPLKGAIFASGLPAKDPFYTQILSHPGFSAPLPPAISNDPSTASLMTPGPMPIQSLHLWGLSDDIISPEWSKQLMGYPVFCGGASLTPSKTDQDDAEKKRVAESEDVKLEHTFKKVGFCPSGLVQYAFHDGGHVVASNLRKPIKAFLQMFNSSFADAAAGGAKKKPAKMPKKEKKPKQEEDSSSASATTSAPSKKE